MYVLEKYYYDWHEFSDCLILSLDKELLVKYAKEFRTYNEPCNVVCTTKRQHEVCARNKSDHYWIRKLKVIK